MNEAFNPYYAFLGLDPQVVSPSYYQLLGLRELEGDASKITAAAEKAIVRVRGQRPGQHAPEWSRLLDEIQAAKACLLDLAKKRAYDERLTQKQSPRTTQAPAAPTNAAPQLGIMGPAPQSPNNYVPKAAPQPVVPTPANDNFPPHPAAGYAPPGYAPTANVPNPAWTAPYTPSPAMHPMAPMPQGNPAMMPAGQGWPTAMPGYAPTGMQPVGQPFDPMAPMAYPQTAASPYAAPMGAYPTQGMPNAYPMPMPTAMPVQQAAAFPIPSENFAAPTLVKGRPVKRRRSKGPLLLAGTVVGSIAVVGGVLYALNGKLGQTNATQPQVAVNTLPQDTPPKAPAAEAPTPVQPITQPAPMTPVENTRPMRAVVEQPEETSAKEPPEKMPAEEPKEAMTLPIPEPTPAKPTTPSPEPTPEPPPSETPETNLPTREELVALTKAVKDARTALGEFSFDEADELLVQAEMLAKLPEHHDRINRLQNVAKLARLFREAIVRTMGQLEAGEVLKVGSSTEAAIVNASPTELTIRLNGDNRTYTLETMPLGLAVHLGERSLNPNSPATRAAKGAYVFIDKRSDAGQRKKAQTWWEEAQLNGMDMRELMPVLTDKYDFAADAPKESEESDDAE